MTTGGCSWPTPAGLINSSSATHLLDLLEVLSALADHAGDEGLRDLHRHAHLFTSYTIARAT